MSRRSLATPNVPELQAAVGSWCLTVQARGHFVLGVRFTVAADLQVQPDDVAVGYRAMIGNQQWLLYRSLARPANRTVLGHNLSTEMLLARFDRKGAVQPLVEIE